VKVVKENIKQNKNFIASSIILVFRVCRVNVAANEQGLALLGYLKNVCRQLKPNIVLKVEDNNKS